MITELQEIAKSKEGEILSTSFISPTDKLNWKCKEGHEWQASLLSIQHGAWCSDCYFNDTINIDPRKSNQYEVIKKHYFLYKVTNTLTDKYYIGVHCTNNLQDNYMGSGKYIKNAIKKHGLENFKIEYLEFFTDSKSALAREKQIVTREFIKKTSNYNRAEGGGGGYIPKNKNSLKKLSKANKGKVACINAKGEFIKVSQEEFDNDPTLVGQTTGRCAYYDKEKNIVITTINDPRVKNGELIGCSTGIAVMKNKQGKIVRTTLDDPRIKNGELVGITSGCTQTNEANNKRRNSQTGVPRPDAVKDKCSYCNIVTTVGNIHKWHGEKCVYKNEINPEEMRLKYKTPREFKAFKLGKIKLIRKPTKMGKCKQCKESVPLQNIPKYHNEKCWKVTGLIKMSDTMKATDRTKFLARNLHTGEISHVPKEDFPLHPDLVYVSKGILMLQDSKGKIYRVEKNDPRLRTGELLPLKENLVIVEDSRGHVFEVYKDCPNITSGQLKVLFIELT